MNSCLTRSIFSLFSFSKTYSGKTDLAGSICVVAAILSLSLAAQADVGRISGEFDISSYGSAQYSIPIDLPAGMNGLRPDIALVYDSSSGVGLAGEGWNLQGFPQIHRCGSRHATDGATRGLRFDEKDRFCLDGNPLILVSGSYGGNNAEYRTETHRYEKVQSFGSLGSGPSYFDVTYPNGLIFRFGNDSNSRIIAPNTGGEVRVWALNLIIDTYDNRISYEYVNDAAAGEFYPWRVMWTYKGGAGASSSLYRLIFEYEDLPADGVRTGYTWGSHWTVSKRLDKITYRSHANHRRQQYDIEYTVGSDFKSRVESISLCGETDSTCLGETTVQWVGEESGFDALPAGSAVNNYLDSSHFLMDFDGDGDDDLFLKYPTLPLFENNWGVMVSDTATDIYASVPNAQGDAPFNPQATYLETSVYGSPPSEFQGKLFGTGDGQAMDIDGDGARELLSRGADGKWHLFKFQESESSFLDTGISNNYAVAVGDVNGDGLDDLLVNNPTYSTLRLMLSNGSGFENATSTSIPAGNDSQSADVELYGGLDFDGNGLRDILVKYESSSDDFVLRAFLANAEYSTSGPSVTFQEIMGLPPLENNRHFTRLQFPDVNGDGLSDLIYRRTPIGQSPVNVHTTEIFVSRGNSFNAGIPLSINLGTPHVAPGNGLTWMRASLFVDYNGDGRDDLVQACPVAMGDELCLYSAESGSLSSTPDMLGAAFNLIDNITYELKKGDLNGDGAPDLIFYNKFTGTANIAGGGNVLIPHIRKSPNRDFVARIEDGLGNYIEPEYSVITESVVYQGDPEVFEVDINNKPISREIGGGGVFVVDSYTANTGVGSGEFEVSYRYFSGVQSTVGRGFLGYQFINENDSRDDTNKKTMYRQSFPFGGTVYMQAECLNVVNGCDPNEHPSSIIKMTTNTWLSESSAGATSVHHAAAEIFFPYLSQFDSTEYELEGSLAGVPSRWSTLSNTNWDFLHGEPRTTTVTKSGAGAHSPATHVTTTYIPSFSASLRSSSWCLGLPDRVEVTQQNGATVGDTRISRYQYNTNCGVQVQTDGPDGQPSKQLVSTTQHDSYGREDWTTVGGVQGLPEDLRRTEFVYDHIGYRVKERRRVITGETDHVETFTWKNVLGIQASAMTPSGQLTSWSYDDFGRVSQEVRGPVTTTITIESCSSGCQGVSNARYKVQSVKSDGVSLAEYFDSYGRLVGDEHALAGIQVSRQLTAYDAIGNKVAVSNRFIVGQDPIVNTTYTYDLVGRIKTESRQASETDTSVAQRFWSYGLNTASITDEFGWIETLSRDVNGNIVSILDRNNATSYFTYTPWGDLETTTDPSGNTKSISYDERGFAIGITDPDRGGNWLYRYNPFGEVTNIRDAATMAPDWTMTAKFDQLGRRYERVEAEGTTTWVFSQLDDESKGLLTSVTSPTEAFPAGFQEQYFYDSSSRVDHIITTIEGSSYRTDFGYDSNGRRNEIVYPEILGSRYSYQYTYSNGYVQLVTSGNGMGQSQVYALVTQDAYGRPRYEGYGLGATGIAIQHAFDSVSTKLTGITSSSSGTTIQDYRYTWNKRDDLKTRTDLIQGSLEEVFNYDKISRLKGILQGSQTTLDITYSDDGNITSKSDFGGYVYDSAKPHAVETVLESCGTCCTIEKTFSYDANGNMINRNGGAIKWTSFNKPSEINEVPGVGGSNDNCSGDCATFSYGPDRQIVKQTIVQDGVSTEVYYIGNHFEVEVTGGQTSYRTYGLIDDEPFTTVVENNQGFVEGYYILRDHLGSVDKLVSWFGGGSPQLDFSFDAFGARRNADWTPDNSGALNVVDTHNRQGFTSHEQIDAVAVVHMGGRVYDPALGRFLSPDPVFGSPLQPQSLNPFSYAQNNPLRYVDPTGLYSVPIDEIQVSAERIPGFDLSLAAQISFQQSSLAPDGFLFSQGSASSNTNSSLEKIVNAGAKGDPLGLSKDGAENRVGSDPVNKRPGAGTLSIDFFIREGRVVWILKGDGRDFDPASNKDSSRISLEVDFEVGELDYVIGYTCFDGGSCVSALPISDNNYVRAKELPDGDLLISGKVRNSIIPGSPPVDFVFRINASEDGISVFGYTNYYPSLEISTPDGFLYQRVEGSPIDAFDALSGFDVFEVEQRFDGN